MKLKDDLTALEIKSDLQPHVILLVLITEDVSIVCREFFVALTESRANRQLVEKPERSPPTLSAIVKGRSEKIGRMLMHGGIGELVMIPEFETSRPAWRETIGESCKPFEHAIVFVIALVFFFVLEPQLMLSAQTRRSSNQFFWSRIFHSNSVS